MPAAAVDSLTPSMAGISGTVFGASGDIFVTANSPTSCPRISAFTRVFDALCPAMTLRDLCLLELLLFSRCRHCGGSRGGGLVEPLDFRGLAQLRHQLGLGLAHDKGLDPVLELIIRGRLPRAFLFQLDDVP